MILNKPKFDLYIFLLMSLLLTISFFILYSASSKDTNLLINNAFRVGLALIVFFSILTLNPDIFRLLAPSAYVITLILLMLVFFIGTHAKGASRWLDIGPFNFQPAEIMKLIMPMTLACYYHDKIGKIKITDLLLGLSLIALPCLLIAKQPDLGTAILVAGSGFAVILFAGISLKLLFALIILALSATPVLWHHMHAYQKSRVLMLFNPESDPLGKGYHIIQAKIALGSGGLLGKGYLAGTQTKLEFLPESTTDFIFCVIGEEFGYIGGCIILLLYLMVIARGLIISVNANNNYNRLLAASLTTTVFLYVAINIAMVSGLLPIVGIPLPLISYGGTSLVTITAALAIIVSIKTKKY